MTVPPGSLAVGVPAEVKGPLTPAQAERVARGWSVYVARAAAYRAGTVSALRAPGSAGGVPGPAV